MSSNLNERQKAFCEHYLINFNATDAAIKAGYSKKTARSIASENLTKPDIQSYLSERQRELQESTGITQKKVLEEYAKVAFADIRKFYSVDGALRPIHELDDSAAGALAGVESWEEKADSDDENEKIVIGTTRKIKTYDKVRALSDLARHLGMFKDQLEISGSLAIAPITGMQFKTPTLKDKET